MTDNNQWHFNILLGDDRSEHALAATALLEDLPFAPGTDVTVFRAFAANQSTDVTLMEEALNQTCNRLKQKGFHAETELQLGSPAEKFLDFAEKRMPDLILIGAKGLRATTGILVGGVAQQVVEYAPCPVLVVRAPYDGLQGILLATDGSSTSRQAVHLLGRLPLPRHARLWVMHVLPPPPIPMPPISPLARGPMPLPLSEAEITRRAKEDQDGQALLDGTVEVLKSMGKPAEAILKRGDAATEIMRTARELEADLLICGSRGLSPSMSWKMGNVSRKLVHYSKCSVLVVRNLPPG
jgi:nucleotide-binding universal stress UspA family protein